jgi:hypothetical protein
MAYTQRNAGIANLRREIYNHPMKQKTEMWKKAAFHFWDVL